MTKVRSTDIRGWRTYEGQELEHGQSLIINENLLASVVGSIFYVEDDTQYDFSVVGAKIDPDGTYYDPNDNTIALGQITAIYNEGFVNETEV